jgi:hypothetical protein
VPEALSEETVTISKAHYDDLLDTEKWYYALTAAGVDNWGGYDMACQIYYGELGEDDI